MADEPATDILDATYRALCEHGYANLTLRDIAAETDKSKASIHYYYDSKDELFVAFLDELYEQFTDRVGTHDGDTARERLETLFQVLLTTDADSSRREFRTAMLELKAQAPYNPPLRERLIEFDEFLFEQLREILSAGVHAGEFDGSVDPARHAEFLTTAITGAQTRHVVIDHSSARLYGTMTGYLERQLLADENSEVAQ
ncbi:TetR family transcriptional regulator [Natrinema pellirubrum DSM 15624]|uniref:Transcriptional regulator n=1 Tax=Natrinema pellirubrum (strain DSM 15624 / CIP 106293 / JCM 10476 / NCIMB 786 / 157) TaxID=797303 RepID=L0JL93_NATP1|nr:TetR/AcrR family transcriptional regulator [Natrinema pellirubrum]AGB31623.1 transcriptional regulator [Natrinema pellirubrum DSM 15624]ELY73140.1 TetR family transcriptional regulator [Natrinema pellirubrum DSM 15624]